MSKDDTLILTADQEVRPPHSVQETLPMTVHGFTTRRKLVIGVSAAAAVFGLAVLLACKFLDASGVHWFVLINTRIYSDATLGSSTGRTILDLNFWGEALSLLSFVAFGALAVVKTVYPPPVREETVRISTMRSAMNPQT